jgi:hypothetical protein
MPPYCDGDDPSLKRQILKKGENTVEKLVFVDEITNAEVY